MEISSRRKRCQLALAEAPWWSQLAASSKRPDKISQRSSAGGGSESSSSSGGSASASAADNKWFALRLMATADWRRCQHASKLLCGRPSGDIALHLRQGQIPAERAHQSAAAAGETFLVVVLVSVSVWVCQASPFRRPDIETFWTLNVVGWLHCVALRCNTTPAAAAALESHKGETKGLLGRLAGWHSTLQDYAAHKRYFALRPPRLCSLLAALSLSLPLTRLVHPKPLDPSCQGVSSSPMGSARAGAACLCIRARARAKVKVETVWPRFEPVCVSPRSRGLTGEPARPRDEAAQSACVCVRARSLDELYNCAR